MIVEDIKNFDYKAYENKRILGIDLGQKRVGLSLSDTRWTIASPLNVLKVAKLDKFIQDVSNIIDQYNVGLILIGLPLNMNGSQGDAALNARQIAGELSLILANPIIMWDERLSTQAITRTMIDANLSRARQKEVVDKMAASFVLQGYLDWLRYKKY